MAFEASRFRLVHEKGLAFLVVLTVARSDPTPKEPEIGSGRAARAFHCGHPAYFSSPSSPTSARAI